jgi:hypothetical protein
MAELSVRRVRMAAWNEEGAEGDHWFSQ